MVSASALGGAPEAAWVQAINQAHLALFDSRPRQSESSKLSQIVAVGGALAGATDRLATIEMRIQMQRTSTGRATKSLIPVYPYVTPSTADT